MYVCNILNLSSMHNAVNISPSFMTAALILHFIEFTFLIISWFLVTYILIFFKRFIKIFHINICFFLIIFFVIYYFHFIFRNVLFLICYADKVKGKDVSPNGPLKWLHIGREFCLFVGGNLFPLMYVERFYASRDLQKYENIKNIFISFILTIFCVIFVAIFETARFFDYIAVVIMPSVILFSNLFSAIGMYFIVRRNNQFLQDYYSYQLSEKVQIRGNIKTCSPIFPNLIVSTCSATIGAIIYSFAFYTQGQIGFIFSMLFDLGISIYLCVAPTVMIIFVKELRKNNVFCFLKSVPSTESNEQNIYFQQLKTQWS